MTVFRITKAKYERDLAGLGAQRFGGRWNSKGIPALYTSQYRSICILELLVHTSLETVPADLVLLTINLPDDSPASSVSLSELPESWNSYPFDDFTRQTGDEFLKNGNALALKAPSAIIQEEYNYVINPQHLKASQLKIVDINPLNLDHLFFGSKSSKS